MIRECNDLSSVVPFGDSQAKKVMFRNGESPAQEFRHHVLQLSERLATLKETEFKQLEDRLDLDDLRKKLKWAFGSKKKRVQIQIERMEFGLYKSNKLIEDAVREIQIHKKRISELPEIESREVYESMEIQTWVNKLMGDVRRQQISGRGIDVGTLESLEKIGLVSSRNDQGVLCFAIDEKKTAHIGIKAEDLRLAIESETTPLKIEANNG